MEPEGDMVLKLPVTPASFTPSILAMCCLPIPTIPEDGGRLSESWGMVPLPQCGWARMKGKIQFKVGNTRLIVAQNSPGPGTQSLRTWLDSGKGSRGGDHDDAPRNRS